MSVNNNNNSNNNNNNDNNNNDDVVFQVQMQLLFMELKLEGQE